MDEESAGKSAATQSSAAGTRDGLIDFSGYTIEQLRELQYSVDQERFPLNYGNLIAALRGKEEGQTNQTASQSDAFAGQFTSAKGFLSWLAAKARRSPLYGLGTIEPRSSDILLGGWQRTWLGVPIESQIARSKSSIQNAVQDGQHVQFDIRRRYWLPERIQFRAETADEAQQLVGMLPAAQSRKFMERWSAIREFNLRVNAIGNKPWVTGAIVAINVVIYVTMAIATRKFGQFTVPELLAWGANLGPLTVNGQWWRVFTALFVHFNLSHLAINMWALWNVGRLTERLFGSATLAFLYVGGGILASLSSIAWDPSLSTVGASGAIFGVFGAFLAFLSRQRKQIPAVIVRKHWISTAVFVLFSLVNGAIQPGIDNAAHVGGLLCGFVLGYILARPLEQEVRARFPRHQIVGAAAFVLIAISSAIWQVKGIGSGLSVPEQYFRAHIGYVNGESHNLEMWNALAARAARGTISDAELSERFARDIVPFWESQQEQLEKENASLQGPERDFAQLVVNFVDARAEWANAVVEIAKNQDKDGAPRITKLVGRTNAAAARLERMGIRARMDHRPRALSATTFVRRLRQIVTGETWRCVGESPMRSDDKNDGPALRYESACQAQHLFLNADFVRLEALLNQYMDKPEDLPDGTSHFEGLTGGLLELLRSGTLNVDATFGYTADWRRAVKGSVFADLIEAMALSEWAYTARGAGYANTVSGQSWAIFAYRSEMAAAALEEVAARAVNNPVWYTLSLDVGLDQAKDTEKLRAIFDLGVKNTPRYSPLYRRMLRILMPRWGGSYEDVDKFINEVYEKTAATRGYERYTQLYSTYAIMEGDDLDLFKDTPAFWSGVRTGFLGLVKRYPASDAVLNSLANFACRAGDKAEYNRLRNVIGKRFSSVWWTTKYSLESCDKQLGTGGDYQALSVLGGAAPRIQSLSGVRIGMTRSELLAAKGIPVQKKERYWVYNTVDSKHNGVVTAVFSASRDGSEGTVLAIAYSGDQASAPAELPYLDDTSVVDVLQIYGPQLTGHLALHADVTYTFRNGLYINSRDETIYRYGIFSLPSASRH
jgi:membrane associated rhomboid family serine protease